MKIIFATANEGKLREAREILGPGFQVISPADLGITEDVEETGSTLEENSALKADFIHGQTGMDCFADDTGLEVDALDGAPGVRTARFAADALQQASSWPGAASVKGDHDFDANVDRLLYELSIRPDKPRTARFKTCVTLILGGKHYRFEGVMEGSIALSRAGCGGFGYDPVFIADAHPECTTAELGEIGKNEISHRGKALRAMAGFLKENGQK